MQWHHQATNAFSTATARHDRVTAAGVARGLSLAPTRTTVKTNNKGDILLSSSDDKKHAEGI
jgi:hypothetical protein